MLCLTNMRPPRSGVRRAMMAPRCRQTTAMSRSVPVGHCACIWLGCQVSYYQSSIRQVIDVHIRDFVTDGRGSQKPLFLEVPSDRGFDLGVGSAHSAQPLVLEPILPSALEMEVRPWHWKSTHQITLHIEVCNNHSVRVPTPYCTAAGDSSCYFN